MILFRNKPMLRKVWMDFSGNRSRSILVVLSIVIGVFAIGLVVYLQENLRADLDVSWNKIQYPNIVVSCQRFDDMLVNSVKKIPGVKVAQGSIEQRARMKVDGVDRFIAFKMLPRNLDTMRMMHVNVMQGEWPPRADEIFIERATAKYAHLTVGQTVEVDLWNKKEKFKIVGMLYDYMPGPQMSSSLAFYLGPSSKNLLNLQRPYSQMMIMVDDKYTTDTAKITAIGDEVKKRIEHAGKEVRFVQVYTSDEHVAMKFIGGLTKILAGLGVAALLLSGFLLFNTISALILQQTRQIGIMKANGGGTGQIASMYVTLVFMFSLTAVVVAVPSSFVIAKVLTYLINTMFNVDTHNTFVPWSVLALQLAIGFLVPQLAALYPIWRGTSITAREAISGNNIGDGGNSAWVDRLTARYQNISRPLLLSLRNTFRQRGRLILTVAVMTISGAIFVTVMCAYDSMQATLADTLKNYNFDASVGFQRSYRQEAIKEALKYLPEVTAAEAWEDGMPQIFSLDQDTNDDSMKQTRVNAVPPDSKMMEPTVESGRWLLNADENAIVFDESAMKAHPNVKLGDTIIMKDSDSKTNYKKTKWVLVGVVKSFFSQPDIAGTAYVSYSYYCKVMGIPRSVHSIMLKVDRTNIPKETFTKSVEAKLKSAGLQVQRVFTIDEEIESVKVFFLIMLGIFSVMSVMMGFIGALGIAGTMGMNVLERIREIGVMRAIGADNRQIINIFLLEGMLISFISWVLAVMIAFVISYPLCYITGEIMFQSPLSYVYSIKGALIWLVCALAFGALASISPAKRASKISVRDAIAYE